MTINGLYLLAKSLHLIGMVSWMAGLFYLVRLMVYHAEAHEMEDPDKGILIRQYNLMEWRVYRFIIVAALIITWSFGTMMLAIQPVWLQQPWIHVKLLFVVILTGYTHYCKGQIKKLEKGPAGTSVYYRILNEVPTIVLIGAIVLAVYKSGINWLYFSLGVGGFVGLIAWGIWKRNKKRKG